MSRNIEIKRWIKEHKKEIIISGVGVVVAAGIIICVKNNVRVKYTPNEHIKAKDCLKLTNKIVVGNADDSLAQGNVIKKSVGVCEHVRKLPVGYKASQEKINLAKLNGYHLENGQTLVNSYSKYIAVA